METEFVDSHFRSARIEKLRAQVEAGAYQISITALAESILKNEDHFSSVITEHDPGGEHRGQWLHAFLLPSAQASVNLASDHGERGKDGEAHPGS